MDDADRRAREIIEGADASADQLKALADELRDSGRSALAATMLTAVARRALAGEWRPAERAKLATDVLRDYQLFNYARRLLTKVRTSGEDSERLRQQHALCTYKDLELPVARRLARALEILDENGELNRTHSAETLGLAGAIYKRRWDVDSRREDLERSLDYYRRGFEQVGDENRWYAGVNAAFVADRLAQLEDQGRGAAEEATRLRAEARRIREQIATEVTGGDAGWNDATLGEALFGLERFAEACKPLSAVGANKQALWRQETTAMQLAALADLHGVAERPEALEALRAFVGDNAGGVQRALLGKIGLALSGGGFRASLFHIGVLARLAECKVLRSVEVLSCVSGGSILGAFYYLKLKQRLESKVDDSSAPNGMTDADYVALVGDVADEFLAGVRKNLRVRLATNPIDDARMAVTSYSRTDRASELYEELFYGPLRPEPDAWRMPELFVKPAGRGENFSLRYENWLREAKVPILVLNATTLNTGHNWQFTASWMGEPPPLGDEPIDASRRLRRLYYDDAPNVDDLRRPRLGTAVASSACVPTLFPPIKIRNLYQDFDVELVDGGVYDNQGIASLVEQDCNVILVSDASGQMRDTEDPKRGALSVAQRSNSVLMKRVREAEYAELAGRHRAGSLRGLMSVHLTKGLRAQPLDWIGCKEPWDPDDDALPANPPPAYGIDPNVQRAMAELRTDLDAFSGDEAYTLMAAGYLMTKHDLGDALPTLAQADPALERLDWPFQKALVEMTSPDPGRLARTLRDGHARFFRNERVLLRKTRAWTDGLPSKLPPRWQKKR